MATAIEYGTVVTQNPKPATKLRAFARRIGLRGLGDATYETAKLVVAALAANNFDAAISLMSAHTPDEIKLVGQKAIALGADPATVNMLVQSLATPEVIEIVDTRPAVPAKRPWWHYALGVAAGVAAIGGVAYVRRKGQIFAERAP